MLKKILVFIAVIVLTGCSTLPKNWGNEEGYVWCNTRYLDITSDVYIEPGSLNPNRKRNRLAYEGYIYGLLGAIELQKEGKSEDKHFKLPPYIEVDSSIDHDTGFQASVFKVYDSEDKQLLKEVVIAFRGTDQFWVDYSKHNLHPNPKQNRVAQQFVLEIAEKFKGDRLVVTGYSLGGGLAMNVLHNDKTSPKIHQAWAFNSSPRVGEKVKPDPRLYLLSAKGEILDLPRRLLRGGARGLGAYDEHFSDEFNLIEASSFYLHSRWVLARQLLIFADMVYYENTGREDENYVSPALAILKMANEPMGCKGKRRQFLVDQGRL